MEKSWFVYMVECADGSLYTGITTDVVARVAKHNTGKGAKYTRSRLPVKLVWQEAQIEKNVALKKEVALKKMTRLQKQAFLKSNSSK